MNGTVTTVVDQNDSGGGSGGNVPPDVNYQGYSGVASPCSKIQPYAIGTIRGVGGATHAGTGFGGQAPYGGEATLYDTVGFQTTNDLNKAYDYDQITAIANQNGTYSLMEGHPDAAWVTHPATGYRRSIVGGGGGQGQTDFGYGANSPGAVGFSTNSDATQQNSRQTNFATGASQHTMGTGTWINNGNGTSTMVPSTASPSMPPGEAEARRPNCGCANGGSSGTGPRLSDWWLGRRLQDAGNGIGLYTHMLGTELKSAGNTIVKTGSDFGDFVGDHATTAVLDPWGEWGRISGASAAMGDAAMTTAIWANENPDEALWAAAVASHQIENAVVDYGDRLTSDPKVSGQLVGNITTQWAVGGAIGYVSKLVARPGNPPPVPASTPVGRMAAPLDNSPLQPVRNVARKVNGRRYSGHALDRMQDRGLVPSVVEDTIKRGACSSGRNGTRTFTTEQARVILNRLGKVITVYPLRN